nr:DNA helicase [Tanacetum cinerariifolium]
VKTAREKLLDSEVPPFNVRLFNVVGAREYELPTGDMLGAIVYEPVSVAFCYGEDGYSKDMKMVRVSGMPSEEDRWLTMKAYYSYMLHDHVNSFNYLSKTGRLFHQYMVTAFCAVEQSRIDFIRAHQNDIRNEYLSDIYDAIRRGDSDGSDCGGRLILPQSFTWGPRYMYAHYLDALAICRIHGNPSYFITFTCNVKWPEITEYMHDFRGVTTADKSDIVDRIFEMKIHQFVKYLRDTKPFGKVIAIVYTVEFQKRGLPHCHTLLWIDENSRVHNYEDIDNYISAELPSKETDLEGHRVVAEFMIHGPCGTVCPTAACMKNGPRCTDRIAARLTRTDVPNDADIPSLNRPHEACWRLFEFDIHYRDLAVQVLAVHVENMQRVVFRERDQLESMANNPHKKKTTLTEWLDYNSHHADGRQLTYLDFPSKYVWDKSHRYWQRRRQLNRYSIGIPNLHIDLSKLENYTKYEFEACLNHCSRSLTDFGIPLPPEDLMLVLTNRLLMEKKSYDRDLMEIKRDKLIDKLNNCQRNIFNLIIHVVATKTQELIFVYGHGGTGKTFMWKTTIYALRGEGKIVLAVASSGIASLLLPSGRTDHSRFKLPLDLSDSFVCLVTKNTQLARLLKETDLIIWDESPMNNRRCFETLDRTLRDILDTTNKLFGGKPIMLGGDFRQTLPVKKSASRDGVLGVPDESDPENTSWLEIPEKFQIPNDENGLTKLIEFIYDKDTLLYPNAKDLQDKAIVCPKNDTADVINAKVMDMLPGYATTYISNDEAIPHGHNRGEVELLYPVKYLNTLNFVGIPPHELNLKIGSPIITMKLANVDDTAQQNNGKIILTEPKITYISELSSTAYDKTIEAIVYRKWTSKTTRTRTPTKFCCILIDRQGTPIQANMGLLDVEYFDQLLQLQKAYQFTGFSCEPTDKWERTLPTETSLIFGRFLQADCKESNINSGNIIGCTIWNEMAANFDEHGYHLMEKPVVIAVTS